MTEYEIFCIKFLELLKTIDDVTRVFIQKKIKHSLRVEKLQEAEPFLGSLVYCGDYTRRSILRIKIYMR